jgi:aminoglycoside 6-adenylyltransferase
VADRVTGDADAGSDPTGLTPLTGILLVGGASTRFGSPKALADFRGETLGERAWQVLGDVCDERLALGKGVDSHDLPFPVLDDGAEDRAPVYGVLAGLRAASHEVCVFLPVDCPLVTPAALHALGAAVAVPQTGPLPGAYARDVIPEVERRLREGELSLRGLNPRTLEVDESLLVNVNTPMDLIEAAVADWSRERADVHAAVVVGSRARTEMPADRWSDLDVILVVDDPEAYASDDGWIAEFGVPVLTFLEQTAVGDEWEWRVLYQNGLDVDLPLVPLSAVDRLDVAASLLARGYRVLVDKIGLDERLRSTAAAVAPTGPPTEHELTELANDFWYHALWTAKKLRRGEVFTAIECLDAYLKARLATLLAWHARASDPSVDTWHGGRFLERWADPGALAALEDAYARYDLRDVARALWATIDLWQQVEIETARMLGHTIPLDHEDLRRRIAEVVPDPRRG